MLTLISWIRNAGLRGIGRLRGCSISELDYQDRLRVLLAIQSMDSALDIDLNKFLESIPPSRTHTIMK